MLQRSCWLTTTTLLLTLQLRAGEPSLPRPLTEAIEPLVREALEKDPLLAGLRADLSALAARAVREGAPADPMTSLTWRNDGYRPGGLGSAEDTGLELMISQPLAWPGKLRLRAEVARAGVARGELALARRRLDVERGLRQGIAELLLSRDRLSLLDEERATLREVEEATRARYAAGLAVQQDVLRAQAELLATEPTRQRERGRERIARAGLNRLLSRPPGETFPLALTLEEVLAAAGLEPGAYGLDSFLALAERLGPELSELAIGVAQAEKAVELARLATRPDLAATASHLYRGDMPPMWSLGAAVNVPLFSRRKQRQELVEAEAALSSSRARLADLRRDLAASTEVALARLQSTLLELSPLQKAVIVQDRLAVESAVGSYRAGTVPFVAVLEALRNLYAARREALDTMARALSYEADLWAFDPSLAGSSLGATAGMSSSAAGGPRSMGAAGTSAGSGM